MKIAGEDVSIGETARGYQIFDFSVNGHASNDVQTTNAVVLQVGDH